MYIMLLNNHNSVIASTFPTTLNHLALTSELGIREVTIKINGGSSLAKCKIGRKTKDHNTVVLLTNDTKCLNRNKVFSERLYMSFMLFDFINVLLTDQANMININTKELIHNLVKLNSYNIQNIFSVVPQQSLTKNISSQRDIVKKVIDNDNNDTVPDVILDTVKNNLAMQVEFSVFDKLLEPHPSIDLNDYDIREVLLTVIQVFYNEFKSNRVGIKLADCEREISIDYQLLTVSLFYLLDNSVKYCCPRTTLDIKFDESVRGEFGIIFDMISLKIKDNEIEKLTEIEFRGEYAKQLDETGSGIGLNRVVKTLRLNNAELTILNNTTSKEIKSGRFVYQHNVFRIDFTGQSYKY
jgi:hypothetical protein